jgi:hypothetical protein
MKISTQAKLISTALVAVAIAAPIAHGGQQSSSGSYPPFKTGEGFSFKAPSYWNAAPSYWSTARHAVAPTAPRVNRSLGVPPQYLGTGTQIEPRTPRVAVNRSLGVPPQYLGTGTQTEPRKYQAQPVRATSSAGFDWLDAGIGAAFVAGLGALGLCAFVAVRRRHGLAQLEV